LIFENTHYGVLHQIYKLYNLSAEECKRLTEKRSVAAFFSLLCVIMQVGSVFFFYITGWICFSLPAVAAAGRLKNVLVQRLPYKVIMIKTLDPYWNTLR
jgi:hypothetical protein